LSEGQAQLRPLTKRDIRRLKEAGYDPHDLKLYPEGTDLFKDDDGNVFERGKLGGPAEPVGINLESL